MSEYYTAGKAMQVLGGITYDMLRQQVEHGKIQRIVPPGRRQGYYRKKDVDALAKELHAFREQNIHVIDVEDSEREEHDGRTNDSGRGRARVASG